MDPALLKQLKERVEGELRQREAALLDFWLTELKKIEAKRHRDLAGLNSDIKGLIGRMETRLSRLKGGYD
jgi:predicted component of type VI protein secretion system